MAEQNKRDAVAGAAMDWTLKFQAIKAVSPRASVDIEGDRWRVFMPDVEFYSGHEEFRMFSSGRTPEDAVHETWFYLTGEDHRPLSPNGSYYFPTGRIVAPMEKGTVIIDLGAGWEAWVRWNGFMWASYSRIIQRKNDCLILFDRDRLTALQSALRGLETREDCWCAVAGGGHSQVCQEARRALGIKETPALPASTDPPSERPANSKGDL